MLMDRKLNYNTIMKKRDTLLEIFALLAIISLVLSYVFVNNKNFFRIGYYSFCDIIILSSFIKYNRFLNTTWKILWILFLLSILSVILSNLFFPTLGIKDIATFSILIFAISYNRLYKKYKVIHDKINVPSEFSSH